MDLAKGVPVVDPHDVRPLNLKREHALLVVLPGEREAPVEEARRVGCDVVVELRGFLGLLFLETQRQNTPEAPLA